MPSDWIDDTKLSALRKRLRNVGSETADQAAEAVGDLWRHIEEQDQLRAAHQERDADARRLACRLANATPPSLDYPNGYTRLAERFHAILTDAAMAADTQTPTENDHAD